jgi:alpha-1,6-mannosyltransferase
MILVGDGVARSSFLADAARLGLAGHISWLGHVRDRQELGRIYANCDVFVHPNPREPFGIAPLEAMSSGLPLIAPDSGGVLSYANSSNAWTVAPTATTFADAACEIVFDHAARERRIANALATAERFRWEAVANSYLDLYQDLCRRRTGGARDFPPDFASTPPLRNDGPLVARLTAGLFQRLLTTR